MINVNKKDLNILKKIILNKLPNAKIILFGSRFRGDNRETSDIDIALDNIKKIENKIIWDIKYELQESDMLNRVDIIDYNNISIEFKKIIDNGNVLINNLD